MKASVPKTATWPFANWAATKVPAMAPAIARPVRCNTCAARLTIINSRAIMALSFGLDMILMCGVPFLDVERRTPLHLAPRAGRGVGRLGRPFSRTPKQCFGYDASLDAFRVR